jgi:glycosyltransferase involved in cell wall biosynthesis
MSDTFSGLLFNPNLGFRKEFVLLNSMKVLIIHNILWTHYKSVLFEAIEKNKPVNMEVCVLQIAKNDVSRKDMASPEVSYNYNYHLLFDDYIEHLPKFKKVRAVLSFINSYKPDLVNVTGWAGDLSLTLAIVYSFLKGKKVVISNESTSFDHQRSVLKEFVKRLLVKMSDAFIVFGKTSKEYLLQLGAKNQQFIEEKAAVVDDVRIHQICSLSRSETFLRDKIETKKNFIYVGRIIPVKNIPLLISTFQKIKTTLPEAKDWGLIILGNGVLDDEIGVEISKNSLHIYKFDGVDWQTVPKYLSAADCLVLPSVSEPWGLVVNEAMICGLGVIVSNACGCKDDLIDGNGFVFNPEKPEDLEIAMKNFVQNPVSIENMKNKSTEIIKEFSVDLVAKRILNGFEKLLLKS